MKFFFDTEFIERGPAFPITMLSIGIVGEDGSEYYAINADADHSAANDWVKANVLPHLGDSPPKPLALIGREIEDFIHDGCGKEPYAGEKPEFWAYYCSYDWVVLCQSFGTMMDLPDSWPKYCNDLKVELERNDNPKLPKQTSQEHNALDDARWTKNGYFWLHRPSDLLGIPPKTAV